MMLIIPRNILDEIVIHCEQEQPIEACGILAGAIKKTESKQVKTVTKIYSCQNELHSTTRYKISAEEQYHAFIDIEEQGLTLIGFYHSHPQGSTAPSTIDKKLANYIGYSYLIITLNPIKVTAWIFQKDQEFTPELLSIIDDTQGSSDA
jgi:proteasome lid subunit RPN8/RPN11